MRRRSRARRIRETARSRNGTTYFRDSACRNCTILALLMSVFVTIARMTRREALRPPLRRRCWRSRSRWRSDNRSDRIDDRGSIPPARVAIDHAAAAHRRLSARIAATNKTLNAYVTVTADLARREARALRDPKGPLWGIPIAHKDLFETKGVRTTAGSLLFDQNVPGDNAAIVQHFEDAGAVMLGKTNTHELGGGVTTINPFYGTTRNPDRSSRASPADRAADQPRPSSRICARPQPAATPAAAFAFPRRSADASASSRPSASSARKA